MKMTRIQELEAQIARMETWYDAKASTLFKNKHKKKITELREQRKELIKKGG